MVISRNAGITDAEIEAASNGTGGLSPFEDCLVRAAGELVRDQYVGDETWQALAGRYSRGQLMEAVALVGCWTLAVMMTKSYFENLNRRRLYT